MPNDPLTLIPAMIAAIEPGYRMIDGTLLKALYVTAGQTVGPGPSQNRLYAAAAAIEPGPRLMDTMLLRNLATEIGAVQTADYFRVTAEVWYRLIDGAPWKRLSQMGVGQIAPLSALDVVISEARYGQAHSEGQTEAQVEPVRTSGEGDRERREGSGELPNPGSGSREERPRPSRSARLFRREGDC